MGLDNVNGLGNSYLFHAFVKSAAKVVIFFEICKYFCVFYVLMILLAFEQLYEYSIRRANIVVQLLIAK